MFLNNFNNKNDLNNSRKLNDILNFLNNINKEKLKKIKKLKINEDNNIQIIFEKKIKIVKEIKLIKNQLNLESLKNEILKFKFINITKDNKIINDRINILKEKLTDFNNNIKKVKIIKNNYGNSLIQSNHYLKRRKIKNNKHIYNQVNWIELLKSKKNQNFIKLNKIKVENNKLENKIKNNFNFLNELKNDLNKEKLKEKDNLYKKQKTSINLYYVKTIIHISQKYFKRDSKFLNVFNKKLTKLDSFCDFFENYYNHFDKIINNVIDYYLEIKEKNLKINRNQKLIKIELENSIKKLNKLNDNLNFKKDNLMIIKINNNQKNLINNKEENLNELKLNNKNFFYKINKNDNFFYKLFNHILNLMKKFYSFIFKINHIAYQMNFNINSLLNLLKNKLIDTKYYSFNNRITTIIFPKLKKLDEFCEYNNLIKNDLFIINKSFVISSFYNKSEIDLNDKNLITKNIINNGFNNYIKNLDFILSVNIYLNKTIKDLNSISMVKKNDPIKNNKMSFLYNITNVKKLVNKTINLKNNSIFKTQKKKDFSIKNIYSVKSFIDTLYDKSKSNSKLNFKKNKKIKDKKNTKDKKNIKDKKYMKDIINNKIELNKLINKFMFCNLISNEK